MKSLFYFFIAIIALGSCQNNSSTPDTSKTNVSPSTEIDKSFYEFYKNFHQDSLYQISHITFPLEGQPSQDMGLSENERFYWQLDDWKMHQSIDFEFSDYERKLTPLGDELVVEYIVHKKLGFGMMRRFAKLGDEWFLIYYAGMKALID